MKAATAVSWSPTAVVALPALNQLAVVVSQFPVAPPRPAVAPLVSQKKFAARARGMRPTDSEAAATIRVARESPLRRCRGEDITRTVEPESAWPIGWKWGKSPGVVTVLTR